MKEIAERKAFRYADQHDQPGLDILESRRLEGGWRAAGESDKDKEENAGREAFRHAGQHGQLGLDIKNVIEGIAAYERLKAPLKICDHANDPSCEIHKLKPSQN